MSWITRGNFQIPPDAAAMTGEGGEGRFPSRRAERDQEERRHSALVGALRGDDNKSQVADDRG